MTRKGKEMLNKLEAERARLSRQIEALQNELRGLDRAIALCRVDGTEPKQRAKNVKDTVQKIVEDAGLIGATVDDVVASALNVGVHLERQTVAANLSRGKAAGTYELRDGRYLCRARPSRPSGDAHGGVTAH